MLHFSQPTVSICLYAINVFYEYFGTPVALNWNVSLVNVTGSYKVLCNMKTGFRVHVISRISSSVFNPRKKLCFSYHIHFRKVFLQRQYIHDVMRGYVEWVLDIHALTLLWVGQDSSSVSFIFFLRTHYTHACFELWGITKLTHCTTVFLFFWAFYLSKTRDKRRFATSRKFAGSVLYEVIKF
jgi:hypothetical protein